MTNDGAFESREEDVRETNGGIRSDLLNSPGHVLSSYRVIHRDDEIEDLQRGMDFWRRATEGSSSRMIHHSSPRWTKTKSREEDGTSSAGRRRGFYRIEPCCSFFEKDRALFGNFFRSFPFFPLSIRWHDIFFSCFRVDRRVRYVLPENQVVFYFLSPQFFALPCIIPNLLFFYFLFFVFLLEFSTIRRPMSLK